MTCAVIGMKVLPSVCQNASFCVRCSAYPRQTRTESGATGHAALVLAGALSAGIRGVLCAVEQRIAGAADAVRGDQAGAGNGRAGVKAAPPQAVRLDVKDL